MKKTISLNYSTLGIATGKRKGCPFIYAVGAPSDLKMTVSMETTSGYRQALTSILGKTVRSNDLKEFVWKNKSKLMDIEKDRYRGYIRKAFDNMSSNAITELVFQSMVDKVFHGRYHVTNESEEASFVAALFSCFMPKNVRDAMKDLTLRDWKKLSNEHMFTPGFLASDAVRAVRNLGYQASSARDSINYYRKEKIEPDSDTKSSNNRYKNYFTVIKHNEVILSSDYFLRSIFGRTKNVVALENEYVIKIPILSLFEKPGIKRSRSTSELDIVFQAACPINLFKPNEYYEAKNPYTIYRQLPRKYSEITETFREAMGSIYEEDPTARESMDKLAGGTFDVEKIEITRSGVDGLLYASGNPFSAGWVMKVRKPKGNFRYFPIIADTHAFKVDRKKFDRFVLGRIPAPKEAYPKATEGIQLLEHATA